MNTRIARAGLILFVVTVSGCASHYGAGVASDPYGFFSGIWHGFIFPFACFTNLVSWVMGLFGFSVFDSIQIVGRPNTGLWYYVGFAMGLFSYGGAS